METISIQTAERNQFLDITLKIKEVVAKGKVKEGICIVFCPHTTAGLTINENADPSVKKDIVDYLEELVPEGKNYSHLEGNSDSHIKASFMGSSLNIIIEKGHLCLGTWQGIYFCEFDGPRKRQVYIKIINNQNTITK